MSSLNVPLIDRDVAATPVEPGVIADKGTLATAFNAQKPFRYVVIDNFLKPQVAAFLSERFPRLDTMPKLFREPWARKGQMSDIEKYRPTLWPIVEALQGKETRDFLTAVTGVENLQPDPLLAGSGFHQYPSGGYQDLHVDPNFHPFDKSLHRRINLLIYLTPDWQDEWGGGFDIWDDADGKPGKFVGSIKPVYNRAVIFYSSGRSWHGVGKVTTPEGITRKALAVYYYTVGRPADEVYRDSSAIWHSHDTWWKKAVYPVVNAGIALLKPYAQYLRPLRGKVFDAAARLKDRGAVKGFLLAAILGGTLSQLSETFPIVA
ncbi:MAG: hypothetical protein GC199_01265 [Alphaproteobacteria bacterium]|nr:hypothetical protein [Alphaproteobacteria bacterium]